MPEPEHTTKQPEECTTAVAFYNINPDIGRERIVAILGGGNAIRTLRQARMLTFISCWTSEDANLMLRFGLQKMRRAGISVSTVQRAKFRRDLHLHEIDEKAPSPPYEPFSPEVERHNYGKRFIVAKMTASSVGGKIAASMEMKGNARKRGRSGSGSE